MADYWYIQASPPLGEINEEITLSIDFQECAVFRYSLSFPRSGTAWFTVDGKLTALYITNDFGNGVDPDDGYPVPSWITLASGFGGGGGGIGYDVAAGTTYYLWIRLDNKGEVSYDEVKLTIKPPGVPLWSWNNSNGSASASATTTAYNALVNKGSLSDFNYLVWNDICSKVREIQLATYHLQWIIPHGGLSYDDTHMNTSDKTLTAARFNTLRHNIDDILIHFGASYCTGLSDVQTGDIVRASYFTTITDTINGWIHLYFG